jgi:TPR repeat protein
MATDSSNTSHASKNCSQAQYEEAIQILKNGPTGDFGKVFDLLTQAANKKHPDAIGSLGYLHANGIYVEKDDAKARKFFEEAVTLGSKDSRLNLGLFLIHERGGPKDLKKGLSLLNEMARDGNYQAAIALGEIYYTGEHSPNKDPDYALAYQVLIPPAKAGFPNAQNFIGVLLRDGRIGPKDTDAAQLWLEKAAWQGNAKACTNLAELWNYQSENRKCRIEALRWMVVAVQLGEILSKYHLADITPLLAEDEIATARELAELTLKIIQSRDL